jgi:hypothetical protein
MQRATMATAIYGFKKKFSGSSQTPFLELNTFGRSKRRGFGAIKLFYVSDSRHRASAERRHCVSLKTGKFSPLWDDPTRTICPQPDRTTNGACHPLTEILSRQLLT